jgi:chitinase
MECPGKSWTKFTALFLLLQGADIVFANTQTSAFQPEAPKDCATPCKYSGYNSAGWTSFEAADYFQRCTFSPALFSYDVRSQSLPSRIKVCEDTEDPKELDEQNEANATRTYLGQLAAPSPEFDVRVSRIAAVGPESTIPGQAIGASMTIQQQILRAYQNSLFNSSTANTKEDVILHAHWADAVVGIFIGADLDKVAVANGPLEDFISGIFEYGMGQTLQAESCSGNNTGSSFGIIADMSIGLERLSTVRAAVQAWSQGKCSASANKVDAHNRQATPPAPKGQNYNSTTLSAVSFKKAQANIRLAQYAMQDCQEIEVKPDENCETLAERCNIGLNLFMDFNHKPDCTKLEIKQRVCCSAGELADRRPQKQANGDCAVHQIKPKDSCYSIAEQYGLKPEDIPKFNMQTWGWNGCRPDKFYPDFRICVSPGNPPFPAADPLAICGPTKPGTQKPATGTSKDWGLLNECALKACCNIWGNCGMTDDFCIDKSFGAPGSSSGPNGCIGNCGLSITNNNKPPAQFRKVGYFETWNLNRDCLHMDVDDIPAGRYTHIHYAFADMNNDYKVGVDRDMFDRFRKSNKGFQKIISFGGWAFSTEIQTAYIFRHGVGVANRERLATSLTKFVLQEGLDGIDFDWEYPSVPDMPWLPKSSPNEASDYLEFLRLVRKKLPNKSISIAAPASYWYLKAFPIKEISEVVDYIVYMTYDL